MGYSVTKVQQYYDSKMRTKRNPMTQEFREKDKALSDAKFFFPSLDTEVRENGKLLYGKTGMYNYSPKRLRKVKI